MYGHQRQGSDSAAFKELTKRDAQVQLAVELEKLLRTCSEGNREVTTCFDFYSSPVSLASPQQGIEREFGGFRRLFVRFLLDPASSVQWEKIEKLPDGAVSK